MRISFATTLVLLTEVAAGAQAGDFRQVYSRADGSVLLQVDFDGTVRRDSKVRWDEKTNAQNEKYYQRWYTAYDRSGKLVNQQLVWYFPNEPTGNNTDGSHFWVYWYNPKTDLVWGRCPTPRHPNYQQWVRAKGLDLWQIIPKEARPDLKGEGRLSVLGAKFSEEIIGADDTLMPKVEPSTGNDTITCVDFQNATFS
jgi:hypothetical protein